MSEVITEDVPRLRLGAARLTPTQMRRIRKLPPILVGLVITLAVLWVLFLADRSWTADTSAGAAIDEPGEFVVTLLDGLTFAGLLFVVASGFTLVFGLMRTVNMAHGAFFLSPRTSRSRCSSDGRQDPQHRGDDVSMVRGSSPCWSGRSWSPSSAW